MKRVIALILALALLFTGAMPALADSGEYLVLGADLNPQEQATVLKLLGVKDINDYNVSYITNQEEHEALGNYLPAEVIGSRALSSVLLKSNRGGINVDTQNINYVTKEMYQNALITAGLKNVDMQVAGPSSISGTAALVAATKAYEIMTGETVNPENVDTANQELVVTQDLANEVGEADATELVAALKQEVAENDYTSEQIAQALDNLEQQMGLNISPATKESILDLMDRVNQIDIDPEAIKNQAQNIYTSIQGYVTGSQGQGFFDKVTQMVKNFLDTIFNFFNGNSNNDNSQNQNNSNTANGTGTNNTNNSNNTTNNNTNNASGTDNTNREPTQENSSNQNGNTNSNNSNNNGTQYQDTANNNQNTQNSQGVQNGTTYDQESVTDNSQNQSTDNNGTYNNGTGSTDNTQYTTDQTGDTQDNNGQSTDNTQNRAETQSTTEYEYIGE